MTKLSVNFTTKFKKDLKRARKQNKDIQKLFQIIEKLADIQELEDKYRNHPLKGTYNNCYECHIEPDFLLIYEIFIDEQILMLHRLGSHSDLF